MFKRLRRQFTLFFLIFISLFPLLPLLHSGMFKADDSQSHVVRLASFYQSLSEGNIIPRWAENLNNGFGHPVLMFLYPLTNYLGSFWHFLGFSFIDSTKITFGFAFVFAGVFMYLFVNQMFDKKTAFLVAFLYQFAPYRFVDFYSRAALGEHLAFLAMPLILWSFTRLIKPYQNRHSGEPEGRLQNQKKGRFWTSQNDARNVSVNIFLSSVSLSLLLLSHNAIALMFLPFFFLYLLVAYWYFNRTPSTVYRILISFFLGFGLSGFFWLPAFFEGKYTLRDVLTNKEYAQRFSDFFEFFYTPLNLRTSGYLTKEVGWGQWLAVLGGLAFLIKTFFIVILNNVMPNFICEASKLCLFRHPTKILKQVQDDAKTLRNDSSAFTFWFVALLELTFWGSFFLLNKISLPVWHFFTILQKFQFPWRFLSLSVLTSSILGLAFFGLIRKKSYQIIFITILIFITFIDTFPFWQPRGYLTKNDYFFIHNYSGTTDTGESSPIWSVRGMEVWPKAHLEVIDGQAGIKELFRNSVKHVYEVTAARQTRLVDNTVYFPGWQVLVDDKAVVTEFQDQRYRGLITFFVPKGQHTVEVKFGETKLRLLADYLSLTSVIVLFVILLIPYAFRRFSHI